MAELFSTVGMHLAFSKRGEIWKLFSEESVISFDKQARCGENTFSRNAHFRGDVAQLGEHHVRNVGVVGSNPIISTTETSIGAGSIAFGPDLRQAFWLSTRRYFRSRVAPSATSTP